MRQLVAVPHSEIKAQLDAEKAAKRKSKTPFPALLAIHPRNARTAFLSSTRQISIGEPPSYDLCHRVGKAVCVIQRIVFCRPIVESEGLLVEVAMQVEWLNGHVCTAYSALEQRPEVFHAVCMNPSIDVLYPWSTIL
jgi:hypothetical protein